MKRYLLFFTLWICAVCTVYGEVPVSISIIPRPEQVEVQEGYFTFRHGRPVSIYCDATVSKDLLEVLYEKFKYSGIVFQPVSEKNKAVLSFVLEPATSGESSEAYSLQVGKKDIEVRASGYGGLFYGMQTLLQLFPASFRKPALSQNDWQIPCVYIKDAPRFSWRGLMLDVSRHFFTKEEVMKYIDELSEYKMNVFHWHLTDDQGWRLEISSFPRLTEVGAWRAKRVGDWWTRERQQSGEAATYGGFYTKEDVREVIAYAQKRNVTVMPEIDVPGHSVATLVSYPGLACFKAPDAVNVGNKFYGEDENSLCVGNDSTFIFMEQVLSEVAELFPSPYIHIGGDECFKGFWSRCPKCQARMKSEGLSNVQELQSYFIKRMEKILQSKGKHLVGWDEIIEGGLAPDATVMSWRGMSGGIHAAKEGHHVIMTPNEHCYLDLYQGEPTGEPNTYSMCRLSDSYAFEPVPEGIDSSYILGGQGNLWAESVPTFRHAEYMTWPRGWALSEVLWSQKGKDWDDFVRRVSVHFTRADSADINYSRSVYNAIVTPFTGSDGQVWIELGKEIEDLDIYYTFDGTNPDAHSSVYSAPITIPLNATRLRVITYQSGKPVGQLLSIETEELRNRAKNTKRVVGNL